MRNVTFLHHQKPAAKCIVFASEIEGLLWKDLNMRKSKSQMINHKICIIKTIKQHLLQTDNMKLNSENPLPILADIWHIEEKKQVPNYNRIFHCMLQTVNAKLESFLPLIAEFKKKANWNTKINHPHHCPDCLTVLFKMIRPYQAHPSLRP